MSQCAPRLGSVVEPYVPPLRAIKKVYIHCSAVSSPRTTATSIDAYHRQHNGWACIGYHFFIPTYGGVQYGRDIERTPAAQRGHNTGTVAICVNGLLETDFTSDQFADLRRLCQQIWEAHGRSVTFHGHREVEPLKTCPVFDYKTVLGLDNEGRLLGAGRTPGPVYKAPAPSMPPRSQLPAPAATVSLSITRPLLREGDSGVQVRRLQGLLKAFSGDPGEIDGKFGGRTRRSLEGFQELHHLAPDGVCGPVTWETLETL